MKKLWIVRMMVILLVCVMISSSAEQLLTSWDMLDIALAACPVDDMLCSRKKVGAAKDGACMVTFHTDYGDYMYMISETTGEILDREEPDLEAARSREGFREPLTGDETYDIVFNLCPIQSSQAQNINVQRSEEGIWEYTIESVYGTYFYSLDGYTGEILDRIEPDQDEARSQAGGFQDPLTAEQALDAAEAVLPMDSVAALTRNVSKKADGSFLVTFGTEYGDFIYLIDGFTGEVLEKTEPEMSGEVSSHPLDDGEVLSLAEKTSGLDFAQILTRKLTRKVDGSWVVTLGSIYGDFVYRIDGLTGEILESEEPEKASVEGAEEPLNMDEIMDAALKVCPIPNGLMTNREFERNPDGSWNVTFETEFGGFFYQVDGMTGEILDAYEPELDPELKIPADPEADAIDACTAMLEGYDGEAENIGTWTHERDGRTAIRVEFDWKGKRYLMYYYPMTGEVEQE